MPDSSLTFPSDVILIVKLPDQSAENAYLADVADEYVAWSNQLGKEVRFLSAVAPNPGPQQFPMIGLIASRVGDAFTC